MRFKNNLFFKYLFTGGKLFRVKLVIREVLNFLNKNLLSLNEKDEKINYYFIIIFLFFRKLINLSSESQYYLLILT